MNELKRLEEFKSILVDYHVSQVDQKALSSIRLILLLAPTSSGRNTIIRELIKTGGYHYIVSDTTRKPRVNDGVLENNGVEYWFRTEKEVLDDLKAGKYLEAEIIHGQQVSGTSLRELLKAKAENRIAITDIDLKGAENITKVKPDTTVILVLPPSFEEWQRRFKARGETDKQEYRRRMETARRIFKSALEHPNYQFIINDTIEHAVEQVSTIIHSDSGATVAQRDGRELARQFYKQTEELLKKSV